MMPNPREPAAAQIPRQGNCAGRKRDNRQGTVYQWSDNRCLLSAPRKFISNFYLTHDYDKR